jgi:hypothetical protein
MILYHGTSSRYITQILSRGLLPACSCYEHICLSLNREIATHFGQETALWKKGELVLLTIDMNSLDPDGFCHEMGWIRNSLVGEEARDCLKRPALDMLERYRVIGFNKKIDPSLIINDYLPSGQ